MRWRTAAKAAYLSDSRSSGWPARTKVMTVLKSRRSVVSARDLVSGNCRGSVAIAALQRLPICGGRVRE